MPFDVEGALKAGATEDDILGHLRNSSGGYNVDLALKSGASKRQVIDYLAQKSGRSATLAAKAGSLAEPVGEDRPSVLSDPKGWWNSHSDAEKQQILNSVGEFAGGTAGALAGAGSGPGAMVAAGAGAVAGKKFAQLAGKAVGLQQQPTTLGEEVTDAGVTFGANALGEGVGRYAAGVPGTVKTGMGNLAKRALVKPEGAEVARLAEAQGVPVTAPMISKPLSRTAQVLKRFPLARGPIEESEMAAQRPWEVNLQKIGEKYHPNPVDDKTAGVALKEGLESNRVAAKAHYKPQYQQLSREIGQEPISILPLRNAARDIEAGIPEGMWPFFPKPLQERIKSAAKIGTEIESKAPAAGPRAYVEDEPFRQLDGISKSLNKGKGFAPLSPQEQQATLDIARKAGAVPPEYTPQALTVTPSQKNAAKVPESISFDEAKELRTQLLEAERRIAVAQGRGTAPAWDRRAIYALRDALDESLETSLANKPAALKKWRELSKQYRETQQALGPGSGKYGEGNPTAREIETEQYPEKLAKQVTASVTPFQQAQLATGPNLPHVPPPPNAGPGPISMVQRNYFDRLLENARVNNPANDERLVSPIRMDTALHKSQQGQAAREVLGPGYGELEDAARVGKAFRPTDINPSGTSYGLEGARSLRNLGRAATSVGAGILGAAGGGSVAGIPGVVAGTAAGLYAPRYLARKLVDPRLARFLLESPERLRVRPGGPLAGAIGRIAAEAIEPNPPSPRPLR